MRLRLRRPLLSCFVLLVCLAAGSARGQASAPEVGGDDPQDRVTPGLPITVELLNVTPGAKLSVTLQNAEFRGGVEAVETGGDIDSVLDGLELSGATLSLTVSPDAVFEEAYVTVRFRTRMEMRRDARVSVEAEKPLVLVLETPFGRPVLQVGDFSFQIPPVPPTCALLGCGGGNGFLCPPDRRGNARKCYGFYANNFCCVYSPVSF